ncbi:hypothetical protein BKI52_13870 [marine bacterium AO1-C]|nr:hypothetical protein BKI52_13870 [marine bacterium AO1-C]
MPSDLDWVCMKQFDRPEKAQKLFNKWLKAVTSLDLNDGVTFKPFQEDNYWEDMEYGLYYDDMTYLSTVGTEVLFELADSTGPEYISLDISLHLEWQARPVSLVYQPLSGEPFTLAYTAPLSLQVAWKLHQVLDWLRCKDVHDLIWLLKHPSYDLEAIGKTMQCLIDEYYITSGNHKKNVVQIEHLLADRFDKLRYYAAPDYNKFWKEWETYVAANEVKNSAASFKAMRAQLQASLEQSDFKEYVTVFGLPQPSSKAKHYRQNYH